MAFECFQDEYPANFGLAYDLAGSTIARVAKDFPQGNGKVPYFRWLVSRPQMLFAHLVFAYRNRVFAVHVDVREKGETSFTEKHRQRLLEAAENYNLIPCLFPIEAAEPSCIHGNGCYGIKLSPLVDGLGLVDIHTGNKVDPVKLASSDDIEMSIWEKRDLAIQVACENVLKKKALKILSICSVPGIDPQIWFSDANGDRCWCIVREWVGDDKNAPQQEAFFDSVKLTERLRPFDGFFVGISMSSVEPVVYDSNHNVVPLSMRFSPSCPLYRGSSVCVKSNGLERIYVANCGV